MQWEFWSEGLRDLQNVLGLTLSGSSSLNAYGFSDLEWAGDRYSRRSMTGYVFMRTFIGRSDLNVLRPCNYFHGCGRVLVSQDTTHPPC